MPDADASLVRSVRGRLLLWSGGTTLVVLLVLGAALYLAVAASLARSGTAQLEARADELLSFVRREPPDEPPTGLDFGGGSSGTIAFVVGPRGNLAGRGFDVPPGLPIRASVDAARAGGRDIRLAEVRGTPVRVLSEAVRTGRGTSVVQIVQDRTAEQTALAVLLAVLVGGGFLALVVATGVGAVYARRALVPIRQSLAARQSALQRQREFAADASHELRTPLTVIAASVEHLQRHGTARVAEVGEAIDDIGAEVQHLAAIVDDLLLLARSDSGAIALERLPVELGGVAAEAMPAVTQLAAGRGVQVVLDPEPVPVVGDPTRLRQLVVILADNAVRHSPAGTTVRVGVRRDGRHATLAVEDEGPGVRPEDAARIFDRFYRAPGAPSGGTGLGLAIAAWIVERHSGTIAVEPRSPHGARFVVRLPVQAGAGPEAGSTAIAPAA